MYYILLLLCRATSLEPMSRLARQHLGEHKVIHILISPVREVTGNTGNQGNIKCTPKRRKSKLQIDQFPKGQAE